MKTYNDKIKEIEMTIETLERVRSNVTEGTDLYKHFTGSLSELVKIKLDMEKSAKVDEDKALCFGNKKLAPYEVHMVKIPDVISEEGKKAMEKHLRDLGIIDKDGNTNLLVLENIKKMFNDPRPVDFGLIAGEEHLQFFEAQPHVHSESKPTGTFEEYHREIQPTHYNKTDAFKVIDDNFTPEMALGFYLGNVIKYSMRSPSKNQFWDDIKKTGHYLKKIETLKDIIDVEFINTQMNVLRSVKEKKDGE